MTSFPSCSLIRTTKQLPIVGLGDKASKSRFFLHDTIPQTLATSERVPTLLVTKLFARFLEEQIEPWMKEKGFRRKAHSFGKWIGNQFLLIHFQSVPRDIVEGKYPFTVNLGVFARKLFTFFPYKSVPTFPSISDCHWDVRLGMLAPDRQDLWWELREEGQLPFLAGEILGLLERFGLPMLQGLSTEEGLRDCWLSKSNYGGVSSLQYFLYLTVLLMRNGPDAQLRRVIDEARAEWRGTDWELRIEDHIERLGL